MPTVSLVSKPSMSASCPPLQVRQQEVITAYFAKRITEEENGGIKVKFEETKNAKIGEEVYIIIETQNLQGEELVINILQGKEDVLADMGEAITVQVAGTDTSEIKAKVGYCGDDENITNEADFEDWAVAKVTLQPKEEVKQKEWTECLATSTEKKANLSLLIDAHTKHTLPNLKPQYILYRGEKGEDDNTDLCNHFLYGDDAWFEVEEVEIAPWMEIAYLELGVNERTPTGYKRVKEYYKDGAGQRGLDPIKDAWCSSFVNWVLVETNRVKGTNYSFIPRNHNINNPAMAINYVNKERYPDGVVIPPNKKPPYGSILIIKKFGSNSGHATFVINYIPTNNGFTIVGLGGNQINTVRNNEYDFKKINGKLIYTSRSNTKFELKGFVIPKEYEYDEQNEIYYRYEDIRAPKAGSLI